MNNKIQDADLRLIRENAHIRFYDKSDCRGPKEVEKIPHYRIWKYALDLLNDKGFRVYIDSKFKQHYPSLVDKHRWGEYNKLQFKTSIYPAGFEIEFFQNVNFENPHGGEYDFGKYRKMPKSHKIRFNHLSKYLINKLCTEFNLNFYDHSDLQFPPLTAEQLILKHAQERTFDRTDQKKLSETEKYMSEYDFIQNSKSGVDDVLKCGQLRKFEQKRNGKYRIRRGRIYHNINNMWWIVTSKYKYTNVASFHILGILT